MAMYRVIWEIDAEADSFRDAAHEAMAALERTINGEGIASVFEVINTETWTKTTVDLLDENEKA